MFAGALFGLYAEFSTEKDMANYEVRVKPNLDVEADSEDEAKQILVDALADWGLTTLDIECEIIDDYATTHC